MDRVQVSFGGGGSSVFNPTHRLILGILILILVDFIWVASSELSEHIFHDEKFDKPFFSTYVKTSMFLIFLLGFIFWTPWHERCRKTNPHTYTVMLLSTEDGNGNTDNNIAEDTIDDNANDPVLSPPSFVPVNEPNSGNESDDSARQRSVRFSKLAEVRHLSEAEAAEAVFARLSYQASVQAEQLAYRLANRLTPGQTAQLSLLFCLLWFLANYTFQLALSNTQVGIVNVLSSSSSLFTLLLASIFPSVAADKFTCSKLFAVLISLSGVVVVSLSDLSVEGKPVPFGAIFALISAFFYASYLVFLRKKVDHEDKLDIPMFFGFVGLFNLLILWPLFFLLNYAEIETFEWPTKRQWVFLVINGIIGTVFSEVLWLWGCFLTSSLIATLAISLTIPMSMVADVILKKVTYSPLFYTGAVPMVFSFFAVTTLVHYENWDPIMDAIKKLGKLVWPNRRYQRVMINDSDHDQDQNEALIDVDEEEENRDSPTLLQNQDET